MATLENLEATRDYSVQLLINERNPSSGNIITVLCPQHGI